MYWTEPWTHYDVHDLARGALFLAICGVLTFVVTRARRTREAARLVSSGAAFFVPAGMAFTAIALIRAAEVFPEAHENPFTFDPRSPYLGFHLDWTNGGNWLMLGIVAIAIAGLVGLLEARHRRQPPDSAAFLRGIRNHVATIALAKAVLAGSVYLIATAVHPRGFGNVVFLVPSLLLAPLPGIASCHPGRPLRALVATLSFSSRHVGLVGRFVTAQAVLLVGLFILFERTTHADLPPSLLAINASTVSFNFFPFLFFDDAFFWQAWFCIALTTVASTIFLAAHWLGVIEGYEGAVEEPRRVEENREGDRGAPEIGGQEIREEGPRS